MKQSKDVTKAIMINRDSKPLRNISEWLLYKLHLAMFLFSVYFMLLLSPPLHFCTLHNFALTLKVNSMTYICIDVLPICRHISNRLFYWLNSLILFVMEWQWMHVSKTIKNIWKRSFKKCVSGTLVPEMLKYPLQGRWGHFVASRWQTVQIYMYCFFDDRPNGNIVSACADKERQPLPF